MHTHTHIEHLFFLRHLMVKKKKYHGFGHWFLASIFTLTLESYLSFVTGKTGVIFIKITYRRTLCPQCLYGFLCHYIFTKPLVLGTIFIVPILQVTVLRQKEYLCLQLGSGKRRIQEQVSFYEKAKCFCHQEYYVPQRNFMRVGVHL